jgi:hypothetical protein
MNPTSGTLDFYDSDKTLESSFSDSFSGYVNGYKGYVINHVPRMRKKATRSCQTVAPFNLDKWMFTPLSAYLPGWPDEFDTKVAQNEAQPIFCTKLNITFTVEKYPKNLGYLCNFQ